MFGSPTSSDLMKTHNISLIATDSENITVTQSFQLYVTNLNDRPYFTSTPNLVATENKLYSYSVFADDKDFLV